MNQPNDRNLNVDSIPPEDDPTGGDVYDDVYLAEVSGEEGIGGSTPTPDQSNVDANAHAVGVELSDSETMRITQKLKDRDEHRWELDPDSEE